MTDNTKYPVPKPHQHQQTTSKANPCQYLPHGTLMAIVAQQNNSIH